MSTTINKWFNGELVNQDDMKLVNNLIFSLIFAANGGIPNIIGVTPTITGETFSTTFGHVYFGQTNDSTFIAETGTNIIACMVDATNNIPLVDDNCYIYLSPIIQSAGDNRTVSVTANIYSSEELVPSDLLLATIQDGIIISCTSINPTYATTLQKGLLQIATSEEVSAGTNTTSAVTPFLLKYLVQDLLNTANTWTKPQNIQVIGGQEVLILGNNAGSNFKFYPTSGALNNAGTLRYTSSDGYQMDLLFMEGMILYRNSEIVNDTTMMDYVNKANIPYKNQANTFIQPQTFGDTEYQTTIEMETGVKSKLSSKESFPDYGIKFAYDGIDHIWGQVNNDGNATFELANYSRDIIGINQRWYDANATNPTARQFGVSYYNGTGKGIEVFIRAASTNGSLGADIVVTVDGVDVPIAWASNTGGTTYLAGTLIIPNGARYLATAHTGAGTITLSNWNELRDTQPV